MEIWVSSGKPGHQVRIHLCCSVPKLHSTLCDPKDCGSLGSSVHGIFPGKNTEVDCHFLLQGLFPTQGSNPSFLHCRWILYHWATGQLIKESTVPWVRPKLQMEIPRTNSTRFWCKDLPSSSNVQLRLGVPGIVVHSLSHIQLFVTLWTAAQQDSLSCTISQSLLKFVSIESVMSSNHLIHCHPFCFCLQSFPALESFPEWALCIRWSKYWSFSISPSNEYSGLISFRIDWFDRLAVQGTLKSLLQDHNLKASILRLSAFFLRLPW